MHQREQKHSEQLKVQEMFNDKAASTIEQPRIVQAQSTQRQRRWGNKTANLKHVDFQTGLQMVLREKMMLKWFLWLRLKRKHFVLLRTDQNLDLFPGSSSHFPMAFQQDTQTFSFIFSTAADNP